MGKDTILRIKDPTVPFPPRVRLSIADGNTWHEPKQYKLQTNIDEIRHRVLATTSGILFGVSEARAHNY
jgi:hypothetical protein